MYSNVVVFDYKQYFNRVEQGTEAILCAQLGCSVSGHVFKLPDSAVALDTPLRVNLSK